VEALVAAGFDVRAFVFYNSFNSWGWLDSAPVAVQEAIEVHAGDIRDPYAVRCAVQGCDTVLHLAALIAIPFSYHAPDAYVDTNIKGTLNVLQAVRDLGVSRLVHTSTSEVYGTAQFVPITEEHPLQGQSPYSATKIGADQLALSFYNSFETPVVVIRPFNTFGPRQSARAVIPTIISQLLSGSRRIQLGSLAPTRDFTYVTDTVQGFIAAAECPDVLGEVINLGSNFEVSIGDTARLIFDAAKIDAEIEEDSQRLRPAGSEVERLWADTAKAQRLLNWAPEHVGSDGFLRALEKTVSWFSDPANLNRYKTGIYNI
jgi:dTDP-glucose 4,6-dehydratase